MVRNHWEVQRSLELRIITAKKLNAGVFLGTYIEDKLGASCYMYNEHIAVTSSVFQGSCRKGVGKGIQQLANPFLFSQTKQVDEAWGWAPRCLDGWDDDQSCVAFLRLGSAPEPSLATASTGKDST